MLHRLLERLGRLALRRPVTLVVVTTAAACGLGLFALRAPVDLTFTGIMDRGDPEIDRYFRTLREYELGGGLLLLLEGPEENLGRWAEKIVELLSNDAEVDSVLGAPPRAWFEQQAPWLVERDVFDAWLRLVEQPMDLLNATLLAQRIAALEERFAPPVPGARLIQVELVDNPLDLSMGDDQIFALERRIHEWLEGSGVRASLSGLPMVAAQDQVRTLGTVQRLSPLSLLFVLVLFRFIERRWLGILAAVLPLLLAVAATLGTIGLFGGTLTVMETFFGMTVFGQGIDFAIHLMVRQREERAAGRPFDRALVETLAKNGPGIIAGGVTTAGAFFVVALAPDPVARHLGFSGGLGLVYCLVLMLVLVPAIWVLLERRRAPRTGSTPATPAIPLPMVGTLAGQAARRPGFYLALTGAALLAAACGIPRFRTETDLERVFNRNVPALDTARRIQELFDLNGAPWIVGVGDLEEARRIARRFAEHPLFADAESLADLLPADLDERQVELRRISTLLDGRIAALEAAGTVAGPGPPLLRAYRLLEQAHAQGPPGVEDVPEALRDRLVAPNGDLIVYAYARQSALDGRLAREQRLAAQAIAPGSTALAALLEVIMIGQRPWLWPVLLGTLLFVALVLLADFRDLRLAVLALVPVLVGTVITFGALCWADLGWNVMTTMVVPLILGLGVDEGIHVVHRLQEAPDLSIAAATTAVGRAIVMTTATTCASFLVLLLSDHPGLESMGLVMLVGMPICLLASVTTLPALARLLLRRL